jgi:hypothetical protein
MQGQNPQLSQTMLYDQEGQMLDPRLKEFENK